MVCGGLLPCGLPMGRSRNRHASINAHGSRLLPTAIMMLADVLLLQLAIVLLMLPIPTHVLLLMLRPCVRMLARMSKKLVRLLLLLLRLGRLLGLVLVL